MLDIAIRFDLDGVMEIESLEDGLFGSTTFLSDSNRKYCTEENKLIMKIMNISKTGYISIAVKFIFGTLLSNFAKK